MQSIAVALLAVEWVEVLVAAPYAVAVAIAIAVVVFLNPNDENHPVPG